MAGAESTPLRVGSLSDVGRARSSNEDCCAVFENASGLRLLVVADGMGGHQGGQTASRLAVEAIGEVFAAAGGASLELLHDAIRNANRKVFEAAASSSELHGMGTTVVALLLDGDRDAWVAHVGDSRCYLLRAGTLEALTLDHSARRRLLEQGLSEQEAAQHPAAHTLERAIGPHGEVEVEMRPIPVVPGDVFMLCSDGLWGLVGDDEIAAILGSLAPEESVRALVDRANRAGGNDNVTVQAVAIPGEPPADVAPVAPAATPAGFSLARRHVIVAAVVAAVLLVASLLLLGG